MTPDQLSCQNSAFSTFNMVGLRKFIACSWIFIFLSPTPFYSFQDNVIDSPAHVQNFYEIGSIPTQFVRYGENLRFRLAIPELGGDTKISTEAMGIPPGRMSVVPVDERTSDFTYFPSPLDPPILFVVVSATSNLDPKRVVSQQFAIVLESNIVSRRKPEPEPGSSNYIKVIDEPVSTERFEPSYAERARRRVFISGKKIVLDDGDPNNLVKTYNGRIDLKDLFIYAEHLVVSSRLSLPHANIQIFARKLEFQDKDGIVASLNISPCGEENSIADPLRKQCVPWTVGQSAINPGGRDAKGTEYPEGKKAADGANGIDAGAISVFIDEYIINGSQKEPSSRGGESITPPRFILDGGVGQTGGLGVQGDHGSTIPFLTVRDNVTNSDRFIVWHDVRREGRGSSFGKPGVSPSDGKAPKFLHGKAGDGGKGGTFFTDSPFISDSEISVKGGEPGKPGGKTLGGDPGKPRDWLWTYGAYFQESRCRMSIDDVRRCIFTARRGSTNPGPEGPAPDPAMRGSEGTVLRRKRTDDAKVCWLRTESLQSVIDHASDLYLNGLLERTKEELLPYANILSRLPDGFCEGTDLGTLFQQRLDIESILNRINGNLDYFGNPPGFAPFLAFEANAANYEQEIEYSMRVLYLAYWLTNKAGDLVNRQAVVEKGIEDLVRKSKKEIDEFNVTQATIVRLQSEEQRIRDEIAGIEGWVDARNREIERMASESVKSRYDTPFFKKALQTLAFAASAVPFYQPALSSVASGLDSVAKIDPTSPLTSLDDAQNAISAFNSADFQSSARLTSSKLNEMNPANADNLRDAISLATKFRSELNETQNKINQFARRNSLPAGEIEAELSRLKTADLELRKYIIKAEQLNQRKARFIQDTAQFLQRCDEITSGVSKNGLAIDGLNRDKQLIGTAVNQPTLTYLRAIERRAKDRLLKYRYYLAKAYEYQTLSPFPDELGGDLNFENLIKLASIKVEEQSVTGPSIAKTQLTKDEFDRLRIVYEEPMRNSFSEVMTALNNGDSGDARKFEFDYALPDELLEELNSTGSATFALRRIPEYDPALDNQRIRAIKLQSIRTSGDGETAARVEIDFETSPHSLITKGPNMYSFVFSRSYWWSSSYDISRRDGGIRDNPPSGRTHSLLRKILGIEAVSDDKLEVFAQPGFNSDLTIRRRILPSDITVEIKLLRLKFEYEGERRDVRLR
jgi:hypothetical protein